MSLALAGAAAEAEQDVFLEAYLAPLRPFLDSPEVNEIMVNAPGEVWTERAGQAAMELHAVPALDERMLRRLAEQVARISCQGISRQQPLMGATLPDGARIQFVGPPATRGSWAMTIRRHRCADLPLTAWQVGIGTKAAQVRCDPAKAEDSMAWLIEQVRARRTVLIAGGTSSGKTTFLNALLREVEANERIVLVEDTPEIRVHQPNALGLVAVRGGQGEAQIGSDELLEASLRLRPDRIVLGELRGREAVTFLRAVNTGHPGSFSTIHANSCRGALDQLALMTMQAGLGLTRAETLAYAASVIDIVVHLERRGGRRMIADMRMAANLSGTCPAAA